VIVQVTYVPPEKITDSPRVEQRVGRRIEHVQALTAAEEVKIDAIDRDQMRFARR
jgi:hypothetical protein